MLTYLYGFQRMPEWSLHPHAFNQVKTSVSIIIPARNEAANIVNCLNSIAQQNFPKELLEIIVIDDHSEDETAALVAQYDSPFPLHLIRLSDHIDGSTKLNSYKKKAISIAIQQAKSSLIITTDADCIMGPNWLLNMVSYYEEKDAKFITGPVAFIENDSLFKRFQALDFIGMIGLTGASVELHLSNMCNGANLCYEKAVFEEVGGFQGIDQLASGDDLLLMHKIAQAYPDDIYFIKSKEAIVYTYPSVDIKAFVQQRIRWASKTTSYQDKRITFLLGMVFLSVVLLFMTFIFAFFYPYLWGVFLLQLLIKSVIDFLYLGAISRYFGQGHLMKSFLSSEIYHITYILSVGLMGNFKQYEWKGRKVQ